MKLPLDLQLSTKNENRRQLAIFFSSEFFFRIPLKPGICFCGVYTSIRIVRMHMLAKTIFKIFKFIVDAII